MNYYRRLKVNKEIHYPLCGGLSKIIVMPLSGKKKITNLSIWLCQGVQDDEGNYGTQYHVSDYGGELDELIDSLTIIRDRRDKIIEYLNKR